MQRIVKVLVVVVLMAVVLVVASVPAFARPLRGGVPLQKPELSESFVCDRLEGKHVRDLFVSEAPLPGPPLEDPAECWHTSPGLLKQIEDS